MNAFYYIEVNLICVIFLSFIERKIRETSHNNIGDNFFRASIISSELMCITDAVAGVLNGVDFYSSRLLLYIANMIYFTVGTFTALSWLYYVCFKFKIKLTRIKAFLFSIPFLISLIVTLSNPITEFLFYLDETNSYHRGVLLFVYWIVVFIYLMLATYISIKMTTKEYNRVVREADISFCLFGVFPTLGFLIQILMYGSTTISVGIALGYLFYYVRSLESQVSEDSLTGLNNKKQLDRFISDVIYKGRENPLFYISIDIDDFKKINDIWGHDTADEALVLVANAIKAASKFMHGDYILCRFGGDEFVVFGELLPSFDLEFLVKQLKKHVADISESRKLPYKLEASFGYSYSLCSTHEDVERVENEAIEKMNIEKKKSKQEGK